MAEEDKNVRLVCSQQNLAAAQQCRVLWRGIMTWGGPAIMPVMPLISVKRACQGICHRTHMPKLARYGDNFRICSYIGHRATICTAPSGSNYKSHNEDQSVRPAKCATGPGAVGGRAALGGAGPAACAGGPGWRPAARVARTGRSAGPGKDVPKKTNQFCGRQS